jgi:formiminotetrahydrofolate cyclodeaminase
MAMAYGVFSENTSNLELFRRVIENIKLNKLSDSQKKWRANLIL